MTSDAKLAVVCLLACAPVCVFVRCRFVYSCFFPACLRFESLSWPV